MVDVGDVNARLQFFETLLEQNGQLTLVVDDDWKIVSASQAARRVTGYLSDQLVGMNTLDLIYAEDLGIGFASAEGVNRVLPVSWWVVGWC